MLCAIPIGVLAYDDPFGPDGEGRLDIELTPDTVTFHVVRKSPRTLTQKFDYFFSTTLFEIAQPCAFSFLGCTPDGRAVVVAVPSRKLS